MNPPAESITALLKAWSAGDEGALEKLTPVVYPELRRMAARYMRRESAGNTLQPTALVHEAYLRLVDANVAHWQDRAHFFAVSAQLMRRVLVDEARRQNVKRGYGVEHVALEDAAQVGVSPRTDLVALDDVMNALARIDARKVHVVELRFFGGLTVEETAQVLGISPVTVIRDWNTAKAWLYREMRLSTSDESSKVDPHR